jgi:hypothetical protein
MQIQVLRTNRKKYFDTLDEMAQANANKLAKDEAVTDDLLKQIRSIYLGAKAEYLICEDETDFDVAYHTSVTGDVEFLLARTLHHYNRILTLDWSVYLRCQRKGVAPDIRIERGEKTLSIIEIKSKVGWMQGFFSDEQFEAGLRRFKMNKTKSNPEEQRKKAHYQLHKYKDTFNVDMDYVYMLVPSLKQAHRKKSLATYSDYKNTFSRNAELPSSNLVVFTDDLRYEVSSLALPGMEFITSEFEWMIGEIASIE